MIEAYPLCWPVGQKRTDKPTWSRFGSHTLTQATKEVLLELDRMQCKDPIISTNIPLRKDGMPRADYQRRTITDYGVAVYFTRKGKQMVLACDKWDNIEDNLWAIARSIAAMRGLDRWGVSEVLERAFTGFTAIPESTRTKSCWDILGITPTKDSTTIHARYRELAKEMHPDKGGSAAAFCELQDARDAAIKFYQ